MACELCQGPRLDEELLHRDEVIWICLCDKCKVPLVVFNSHREPNKEENEHAFRIANELFPDYKPRTYRRSIPDHPHFHMEPLG